MRVVLSLDLELTKFDQSCFHISMFRPTEIASNVTRIQVELLM
jgi:hypothetical protein